MNVINQVIVKDGGNSWFGFWTLNEKFNASLNSILSLSKEARYKSGEWANAFWVLDKDGSCVSVQPTKEGAMTHYNESRVVVHYQQYFI